MPKLVIGLVGQAGCGKGTVTEILQKEYGAGYYRFSAILQDILNRLSLEKTRENFITLSEILRQGFGEDVLSYAIEADALTASEDVVIVDGIRRLEDLAALEPLPHFKLIAIDVPAKQRFERLKKRGEKAGETNMTWEQFLEEEKASTEITIPGVMVRAWRTIPNTGSLDDLKEHIRKTMNDLGFTPLP